MQPLERPILHLRDTLDLTPVGSFDYTPPPGAPLAPFVRTLLRDAEALATPCVLFYNYAPLIYFNTSAAREPAHAA